MQDVGEIFGETKEMLLEKAKEFHIDLTALADAGPRDMFGDAKKDPLYLRSFEFTIKTQALLKKIGPLITGRA